MTEHSGSRLAAQAATPGIFSVRAYGALGDGKALDTAAINKAVEACAEAGGGQVRFPPGRYLSGTVHLRSNVALFLDAGTTLVGPHRDDIALSVEGHDVATGASRGEQRAALLALLLLQASFLTLRTGERPVLLLDDIFSEFDDAHRTAVLRRLADHQVIMTAVEMDSSLSTRAELLSCPLLSRHAERSESRAAARDERNRSTSL